MWKIAKRVGALCRGVLEHLSEAAAPVCLSPVSPNVSAAAPARKQRREVEFYKLQVIMVTIMALNVT